MKFEKSSQHSLSKYIKELVSYCSLDYNKDFMEYQDSLKKKIFSLPDFTQVKIGDLQIRIPECIFRPSMMGIDASGLHVSINNIYNSANDELKKVLSKTLILSGGSTLFPNFDKRLLKELSAINSSVDFKVVFQDQRNLNVWKGASILSSLSSFKSNWITKNEFLEYGVNVVHRKCF